MHEHKKPNPTRSNQFLLRSFEKQKNSICKIKTMISICGSNNNNTQKLNRPYLLRTKWKRKYQKWHRAMVNGAKDIHTKMNHKFRWTSDFVVVTFNLSNFPFLARQTVNANWCKAFCSYSFSIRIVRAFFGLPKRFSDHWWWVQETKTSRCCNLPVKFKAYAFWKEPTFFDAKYSIRL